MLLAHGAARSIRKREEMPVSALFAIALTMQHLHMHTKRPLTTDPFATWHISAKIFFAMIGVYVYIVQPAYDCISVLYLHHHTNTHTHTNTSSSYVLCNVNISSLKLRTLATLKWKWPHYHKMYMHLIWYTTEYGGAFFYLILKSIFFFNSAFCSVRLLLSLYSVDSVRIRSVVCCCSSSLQPLDF